MRRLPLMLLAPALLVAAAPSSAAVRAEHDFKMSFTKKTLSTSTGVTFLTDRSDYVAPAAGTPADRVAKTVFVMPAGTRTDTSAVPNCTLAKLEASGAAGCPAASKVGSGEATAITGLSGIDPVKETVTVFAAKNGLLAHLTGLQTTTIALSMRANKITAAVPRTCLPPGTIADGCSNGDVVLKLLSVKLSARAKGKRALVRTPSNCPKSRKWTYKAIYTFVDGETETQTSTSACRK